MQLNLKKIDERISKLQEIRRIAADPELVDMLFEFMATDERAQVAPLRTEIPDNGHTREADDIVNQVMKGTDPQQGSGLWARKR